MYIIYRDELGQIIVSVDNYGIQFLEGQAIFSDGETEYKVAVNSIVEIGRE